jgi:hypothetical protein
MHGWRGHTDASSGSQKRKRLLDLASGSLSAAAGAIGNALCGAVGPAAADSAAAGQQQQPRKRVTGSIMRLGMPGSGGSLPTTGACANAAGELMMPKQQPTGGASRPQQHNAGMQQRQGAGKAPGIAIAAAAAADQLDSDGGDQLIRSSIASAGARQQGRAAFRSNPFSTCQQEEEEEDEEGDCLQGFCLLPSTSPLLLPASGAPAPALRHNTGIASTQRQPQHQYNVAARCARPAGLQRVVGC